MALVGVLGLAGCGGGVGSTTGTQAGAVTVAVTGAGSVRLGSTVQLTATVANSS